MKKGQLDELLKIAVFTAEAKRLGGSVSANQRRFMKAAVAKGKELEPVGIMAGCPDLT
jgi:hypothetical protein